MNRLNQLPFLRLLVPLIVGILAAVYFSFRPNLILYLFTFFFVSFVVLLSIKKVNSNYTLRWIFGLHIYSLFFLLGVILTGLKTTNQLSLTKLNNQLVIGEITDPPQKKDKIVKCVLTIKGNKTNSKWQNVNGKTILFIEKDSLAENLAVGDLISFQPEFKDVPEPKNPLEFDYKKYLSFHLIKQQAFLKTNNWTLINQHETFDMFVFADKIRRKLISNLYKFGLTNNELGVASALILGYKNNIEAQLKSAYSSAGAMHVLAVSGLHVGIIFMIFNVLLNFLDKIKYGSLIKGILLVLILWFYALITGLSPSVIRSATMFSVIIIGKTFKRNSNFFNTLSVSALCMLVYNPFLIFDVGFQLSYSAVAGIVLMQPWFNSFYEPKNWFTKYFWGLLTVSTAAQIATFPLGLYYFHQFPNYFLFSNLIVIPLALFILILGLATLAFSFIPQLATFFGCGLKWLVYILNQSVIHIDQLPYAVSNHIKFTITDTLLVYLIITSIILLIVYRKFYYFLSFSLLALTLITSIGLDNYKLLNQKKLIIYNIPKHTAINFIDGDDNILVADQKLLQAENKLNFHVQNNWIDKGVETEKIVNIEQLKKTHLLSNIYKIDNKHLFTKNNYFQFYNKQVVIVDNNIMPFKPTNKIQVDYLIWTKNCKLSLNQINAMFNFKLLIIDSSNSNYINTKLVNEAEQLNIDYWSILEQGAFSINV
ncbi:MAG: ComEC/Rec2 family competence protein [Flavobacteriales bacterium]